MFHYQVFSTSTLLQFWIRTAQKMKFPIKDFFSKYDQFRSFLWIWSHLVKKLLMENFIFLYSVIHTNNFIQMVFSKRNSS